MKNYILLVVLLIGLKASSQEKLFPTIKGFGGVYDVPFAMERPNPALDYKILVDVNTASEKPEMVHEGLETAAKIVNLHSLAGVPQNKLQVILVVHGAAAINLVNNTIYKQKFAVENPNLPLLTELGKAGVKIYICGQTIQKRNIDYHQLAPEVTVALSAITTITNYTILGYTLMKY